MIASSLRSFFRASKCAGIGQVWRVAYIAVLRAKIFVTGTDDPAVRELLLG